MCHFSVLAMCYDDSICSVTKPESVHVIAHLFYLFIIMDKLLQFYPLFVIFQLLPWVCVSRW